MYRRSLEKKMSEETIITRLGEIPVLKDSWSQIASMYMSTKDGNAVLRTMLNVAESSIKTVAVTTKPIMKKYQPQFIDKANSYACIQLANWEDCYPIIMKPTDKVIDEGKTLLKPAIDRVTAVKDFGVNTYSRSVNMVSSVKDYGVQKAIDVKDYGMSKVIGTKDYGCRQLGKAYTYGQDQVNRTLQTPTGQYVNTKLVDALDLTETYVDRYLPSEEKDKASPGVTKDDNAGMKAYHLGTKVRRRMYRRALKDLQNVKLRSQETVSKLLSVVDLIAYAKSNIDGVKTNVTGRLGSVNDKVHTIWNDINTTELEKELPDTFEGHTIALARRLTWNVKGTIASVTPLLPVDTKYLHDKMNQMKKFSDDIYQSFSSVSSYHDFTHLMMTQTQDKLIYIQETMTIVVDAVFSRPPLSWLVLDIDLEGIQLDDPEPISWNGQVTHNKSNMEGSSV